MAIATLVRLEHRSFFYSDDTPDKHSWRARLRLEGRLALNHARLAQDRTLYAIGDVEYFQPLGEEVEERYVNKLRVRLGLGYRPSSRTRLEAIYVRDWNRDSPEAYAVEDTGFQPAVEAVLLRVSSPGARCRASSCGTGGWCA